MSRNHRKPGVVRVICTDSFHHDQPGYGELGHHHVGTLVLVYPKGKPWADKGFRWYGPHEAAERIETRDEKVVMFPPLVGSPLIELPLPTKQWRTEDDEFVWKFRCVGPYGCTRDAQRHEAHLAKIVRRWIEAKPDTTRILLDITRLDNTRL